MFSKTPPYPIWDYWLLLIYFIIMFIHHFHRQRITYIDLFNFPTQSTELRNGCSMLFGSFCWTNICLDNGQSRGNEAQHAEGEFQRRILDPIKERRPDEGSQDSR